MTDSQKKIYKYILAYQKKHGKVPSSIVTAQHFGVSKQRILQQYNKLIEHGKLAKKEQVVSHFEVVDKLA